MCAIIYIYQSENDNFLILYDGLEKCVLNMDDDDDDDDSKESEREKVMEKEI